jgi:hypothetical protein
MALYCQSDGKAECNLSAETSFLVIVRGDLSVLGYHASILLLLFAFSVLFYTFGRHER